MTIYQSGLSGSGIAINSGNVSTLNVSSLLTLPAGTTTQNPLTINPGVLQTSTTQGDVEFDGNNLYITMDTSNGTGRGVILAPQRAFLATSASVTSGGQFFTASVRPALLANHLYHFKYYLAYAKVTTGTLTFSFSNSAATNFSFLHAQAITYTQGAVSSALTNFASIYATGASTTTSSASASLTAGNYDTYIEGHVVAAANTRLQLLVTDSAGTVTSALGSNFIVTDLGLYNVTGAANTIGNIA